MLITVTDMVKKNVKYVVDHSNRYGKKKCKICYVDHSHRYDK